ncbi:hypothetical protein D9M69_723190 [compost metagenome]
MPFTNFFDAQIRKASLVLEQNFHGVAELHDSTEQHQQKALEAASNVVLLRLRRFSGTDEGKAISHYQLIADELVERAVLVEIVHQLLEVRVGN